MPPSDQPATAALVAFDPTTAEVVVGVLDRAGIRADLGPADPRGDVPVLVPPAARDAALAVLAERMEEIAAAVRTADAGTTTATSSARRRDRAGSPADAGMADLDPDDPRSGPPLVMERFRNLGYLALLLVPLLAVSLAVPGMPRWLSVLVLVVGTLALLGARGRGR